MSRVQRQSARRSACRAGAAGVGQPIGGLPVSDGPGERQPVHNRRRAAPVKVFVQERLIGGDGDGRAFLDAISATYLAALSRPPNADAAATVTGLWARTLDSLAERRQRGAGHHASHGLNPVDLTVVGSTSARPQGVGLHHFTCAERDGYTSTGVFELFLWWTRWLLIGGVC
jgi:hypothetical protein